MSPEQAAAPGRVSGRVRLVVAAVVALALLGTGLVWHFSGRESTDDAQVEGHVVPISPRVGGTVLAVEVRDNQYVEAGTVLVRIDSRDYDVALARARADVAEAEANAHVANTAVPVEATATESALASAQSEVASAQARLASAQARLHEAEVAARTAAQDVQRFRPLAAKEEISSQEFDAATDRAESAVAAVDSARAAVTEAQRGVEAAEARLRQARTAPQKVAMSEARAASETAQAEQARASLRQAELHLEYTTIKAPIAGLISRKSVEPGQVVQPGQPLLAVVPLEDVWVIANFKENQLRKIRPGQPALVSVDAFGHSYRGRVESIAAATGARFSLLPPENASGNFVKVVQRVPVKIVLDRGQDPDHLLRPGMSVEPTVITR